MLYYNFHDSGSLPLTKYVHSICSGVTSNLAALPFALGQPRWRASQLATMLTGWASGYYLFRCVYVELFTCTRHFSRLLAPLRPCHNKSGKAVRVLGPDRCLMQICFQCFWLFVKKKEIFVREYISVHTFICIFARRVSPTSALCIIKLALVGCSLCKMGLHQIRQARKLATIM